MLLWSGRSLQWSHSGLCRSLTCATVFLQALAYFTFVLPLFDSGDAFIDLKCKQTKDDWDTLLEPVFMGALYKTIVLPRFERSNTGSSRALLQHNPAILGAVA